MDMYAEKSHFVCAFASMGLSVVGPSLTDA